MGYRIEKDYLDRRMFKRPGGIAVPDCGYRAEDRTDDDIDIGEAAHCVRDSAESYLSKVERTRLRLVA